MFNATEITGQHSLRVSGPYEGPPKAAAGVARHGGAVAAIGPDGVYVTKGDEPWRIYRLFAFTAAVRAVLRTQHAVIARLGQMAPGLDGPYELTVTAPGADGALLGAYAPVDHIDSPPLCTSPHPVVRLEIEQFPADDNALNELRGVAMSRVVNLFGTVDPLY